MSNSFQLPELNSVDNGTQAVSRVSIVFVMLVRNDMELVCEHHGPRWVPFFRFGLLQGEGHPPHGCDIASLKLLGAMFAARLVAFVKAS